LLTSTFHLIASPLVLESEGLIKVRAYRGDTEIRLGTLKVVTMPRPEDENSGKLAKPERPKRPRKKAKK
jgi:hypothetical protein